MSNSSATAKARSFRICLLDHGVPEVSIEIRPGRPPTHKLVAGQDSWDALSVVTNFSHHTASVYKTTSLTPCLNLVKVGRSDVPGPLCNGYGGWDLTARLITFGYANHSGSGGPITVPKMGGGSYTIPKDSARRYSWGWEFEGGIKESDWDKILINPRNKKTMTMREFMGRCGAATQDYFGLPRRAHLEHKTWAPTRKIDRVNYTQAKGIAEIEKYDSEVLKMDQAEFQKLVAATPIRVKVGDHFENWPLSKVLGNLEEQQDRQGTLIRKIAQKLGVA